MTESHPIGPYVRRFLLEYVIIDRCLSRNTQKSYRDAIRLLLQFLAKFYSCDATQLTVEQVTADAVRSFLTQRQKQNGNSAATSNQRLATIHSFIRFAARQTPELLDLATQVRNIPLWRVAPKPMPYLYQHRPMYDSIAALRHYHISLEPYQKTPLQNFLCIPR